jgi:hypothetical protein
MVRPGEHELGGGVGSDAGLVEQLRCEPARERFDLAGELTLLGGQRRGVLDRVDGRVELLRGVAAAARVSAAVTRCVAAQGL